MNRNLLTAIATLIAAVVVAPMASAQTVPPWATPENLPCVTWVGGGWVKVVVSGVLRTCSYAEAYQLFERGNRVR